MASRLTTVEVETGPLEVWLATDDDPDRHGAAPLVFLHEGLGSVASWRDVPARIHAATRRRLTLSYSRNGYGRSAPATLPRAVTYMHEEADVVLPAVLEHFAIQRPILVGHSDGASIALLLAGGRRQVSGLVLVAPHVFVEDVTIEAIEAARAAYETADLRARLARHHDDVDATFRGWNDVWLDPAFRAWNIEDRLAAIDCPVLLIQGDRDPYGSSAQLDAIESGVVGPVRRVLVPGAGHAPHIEEADQTIHEIVHFIEEIDPRRPVRILIPDSRHM